jgi:serine protease Do
MLLIRIVVLAFLPLVLPASFQQTAMAAQQEAADTASTQPGYLGVMVTPLNEQVAHQLGLGNTEGAFVQAVRESSPAAKAGLQPKDVILSVNNTPISDVSEFGQLVAELPPHRKVKLALMRDRKLLQVTAVLAPWPAPPAAGTPTRISIPSTEFIFGDDIPTPALRWYSSLLGIQYEGIDSQLAEFFGVKQGVLIRYVHPGSPAEAAGLKSGDVVVKVNEKATMSPRGVALALQSRPPNQFELPLEIVRDHKLRRVKIKINN